MPDTDRLRSTNRPPRRRRPRPAPTTPGIRPAREARPHRSRLRRPCRTRRNAAAVEAIPGPPIDRDLRVVTPSLGTRRRVESDDLVERRAQHQLVGNEDGRGLELHTTHQPRGAARRIAGAVDPLPAQSVDIGGRDKRRDSPRDDPRVRQASTPACGRFVRELRQVRTTM